MIRNQWNWASGRENSINQNLIFWNKIDEPLIRLSRLIKDGENISTLSNGHYYR